MRRGEIELVPNVVELLGDHVRLADGSQRPANALLLGTGYETGFPFLPAETEPPTMAHAPLYRGIVLLAAPDLHYVGLLFALGALIPMFEAQANWLGEVLAGRLMLPSAEVMRTSVEHDAERRARDFDPRFDLLWDRLRYIRTLESETRRARRRPGVSRRAAAATT